MRRQAEQCMALLSDGGGDVQLKCDCHNDWGQERLYIFTYF